MSARDLDELDALLADQPIAPATVNVATARRCRPHKWAVSHQFPNGPVSYCLRCGAVQDEAASRRGKSSRRLGNDGERRSEKRYGWRKTGEFGGIEDLVSPLHVVQQKTTRSAPPVRWKGIFARLDQLSGGRIPLILLSFVAAGRDTEDFIVIRGKDWLDLFGKDGEA